MYNNADHNSNVYGHHLRSFTNACRTETVLYIQDYTHCLSLRQLFLGARWCNAESAWILFSLAACRKEAKTNLPRCLRHDFG